MPITHNTRPTTSTDQVGPYRRSHARPSRFFLLSTALIFFLFGTYLYAGGSQETGETESLTVVATTNIVGDVVRNITGDAVDVTVLMAVGQNPHSYEPTPQAMALVERADIIFTNGLDLEENLLKVIEATAGGTVVELSDGIDVIGKDEDHDDKEHAEAGEHDESDEHEHDEAENHEEDEDDHHHAVDPHVWFAPTNILIWIDNVEQALIAADSSLTETITANAAAYRKKIEELDAEIRHRVAAIPREERKLVVDHASLGYFAREYDFDVIGSVIPSTTDQAESSARAVAQLVTVIREEQAPAIFVGGTASEGLQNLVQAVAEEVGQDLKIRTLLTGSLAPPGERGDTYVGFIEYNVDQITGGLGY